MIALLLALHPKAWRERYGEEFRELLETQPLSAFVVLNVLGNAARQHARIHHVALRLILAIAVSAVVERFAVTRGFSDNILWSPDSWARALLLVVLVLPWVPLTVDAYAAAERRLRRRHLAQ